MCIRVSFFLFLLFIYLFILYFLMMRWLEWSGKWCQEFFSSSTSCSSCSSSWILLRETFLRLPLREGVGGSQINLFVSSCIFFFSLLKNKNKIKMGRKRKREKERGSRRRDCVIRYKMAVVLFSIVSVPTRLQSGHFVLACAPCFFLPEREESISSTTDATCILKQRVDCRSGTL